MCCIKDKKVSRCVPAGSHVHKRGWLVEKIMIEELLYQNVYK